MSQTQFDAACPYCGTVNTHHDNVNGDSAPTEGAISICFRCVQPSIYTADLSLRIPTPEERKEIDADPDVIAARRALHEITLPKSSFSTWKSTHHDK